MLSRLKKGDLFTSIVYVVLGLFLVFFPFTAIGIACKIIGAVILVYSGIKIWAYAKGDADKTELTISILTAVLGLILVFSPDIIIKVLPVILGIYIIVQGAGGMKHAVDLKNAGYSKWNVSIVVSILMLIVGLVILFSPMGTAALVVKIFGGVLAVEGIMGLMK